MTVETQPQSMVEPSLPEVERICRQALSGFIEPAAAVDEVTAQLLDAELRGKHSHGVVRIPWLKQRLGEFHHRAPQASRELPWLLQLGCRQSLGYLAAREAQRQLLRMLSEQAFAVAVCKEAFPTGVLGDYLRPLAESGHVAIGFATSPPLLSLQRDAEPSLGTNPMGVAMPAGAQRPAFVADISPASITFGQLLAMLSGFDGDLGDATLATSEGNPPAALAELFDDQDRFSGRIIQSLESATGRRQYALLMAIESLTALFAGGTTTGSLVLLAFDPQRMPGLHPEAAAAVIERIAGQLAWQNIPGGHGETRRREILAKGSLPLPESLWGRLNALAQGEMAAAASAGD
ncbi:MAG: Ldh family oxidoreductase [Candidatus Thiodiazotropha sp.]